MKNGLKWGKTEGRKSRRLLNKSQNIDINNGSEDGEERIDLREKS